MLEERSLVYQVSYVKENGVGYGCQSRGGSDYMVTVQVVGTRAPRCYTKTFRGVTCARAWQWSSGRQDTCLGTRPRATYNKPHLARA